MTPVSTYRLQFGPRFRLTDALAGRGSTARSAARWRARRRILATTRFFEKALREAKAETSWDNPNQPYEAACRGFARALLERTPNPFLADFAECTARAGLFAMLGGISQTVLRLTAPGAPEHLLATMPACVPVRERA